MRYLVELIPLLMVLGFGLYIFRATRSRQAMNELENLRTFKDRVRDLALDELEIDSSSPIARQVLDEIHQVEKANSQKRALS